MLLRLRRSGDVIVKYFGGGRHTRDCRYHNGGDGGHVRARFLLRQQRLDGGRNASDTLASETLALAREVEKQAQSLEVLPQCLEPR